MGRRGNGWLFTNGSFHDIGTSTKDLGRGRQIKTVQLMQYAFKTPTLRSVALRPPYLHDGSAPSGRVAPPKYSRCGSASRTASTSSPSCRR